jgi:transcriptional regulator with XRE-family HTH domain
MRQSKRDEITKLGYRVTGTQEFLGLSTEEMELIDLKISLIEKLKQIRYQKKITQKQLARLIQSSQSRVAMLEQGRPDVSLDLICRALFALGMDRRELGKAITSSNSARSDARRLAISNGPAASVQCVANGVDLRGPKAL